MRLRLAILGCAALMLAACGGTETVESDNRQESPQAQGPPTTIKVKTAREYIAGMKAVGLPVGKVRCYTESNDPNNLLGRPGGYVEKCDWADKREQPTTEPTTAQGKLCSDPDIDPLDKELCENTSKEEVDLIGGSIETFEKPGGAAERAEYLHSFEGPGILNPGYTYVPKDAIWVLRVHAELTKSQAQAYLKAFEAQI